MTFALTFCGIAILVLAASVAASNWFWAKQVSKLVDRLMSRDFPEYQAAHLAEMREKHATSKAKILRVPLEDDTIRQDLGPLEEFAPPT